MRVLVVDDERELAGTVAQALRESGLAADVAYDGEEALRLALGSAYDAVVLDLLLPRRPGLSVLKEIRRAKPKLPVLLLSALDKVEQRVDGLDRGADDVVVKPVSVAAYFVGGISHVELMEGSAVLSITDRLTKMEKLYWCGLRHDGGIIRGFSLTTFESGEVYLLDRLFEPMSNAIDVSICGLRGKLGKPELVRTVRGIGYRLDAPDVP